MRRTNLRGHALRGEGAPYGRNRDGDWQRLDSRGVSGHGHALCECGATSGLENSGAARKAWHRSHKREIANAP